MLILLLHYFLTECFRTQESQRYTNILLKPRLNKSTEIAQNKAIPTAPTKYFDRRLASILRQNCGKWEYVSKKIIPLTCPYNKKCVSVIGE